MSSRWIVGKWVVDFDAGRIRRRASFSKPVQPDARLLRVLQILVENREHTVPTAQIRRLAWDGRVVSNDSVSTAVYQLRKLLGDDAKSPDYIVTIPHDGYKLIAATKPSSRHRPTITASAGVAALATIAIVAGVTFALVQRSQDSAAVYIAPMVNSTGDPRMQEIMHAVDATLASALIRYNPDLIATRSGASKSSLRMESEVVACDTGVTLVVRLIDTSNEQFLWSEYYDFDGDFEEPSLVEHVAGRVTRALAET